MEIAFANILDRDFRSGISSLNVLEEEVFNTPVGFGFKKFSPLFETFNSKLGQILDHGFHRYHKMFIFDDKIKQIDDIGPQVLTMDHLGVAFIACLIPLGLAAVVFLMEVVASKT